MVEIAPDGAPRDRSSREAGRAVLPPWFGFGLAAVVSASAAIAIVYRSRPQDTQWSAVALWAAGLALWCLACRAPADERARRARLRRADLVAMAALAAIAAALILPSLEIYPLMIANDPVRDGGLLARWIADGEITRIFDYGYYGGYSLLVPLLGVPFYWMFPTSSLAFKGLAALAGIVAPPLLFFWARRFLPLTLSAAAALLMLALPVYLFYARSEPVVAFNPLLMIAVLGALIAALEPNVPARKLGLLGALAGLSVYFHGGVKVAGFAALGLAALVALWRACTGAHRWKRAVSGGAAALLGVLIGFGPLLQVTDLDRFVSRQRLGHPGLGLQLHTVLEDYETSLHVFFDQPTTSWFPKRQPLIPSPALAGLFAFGAALGFLAVPRRIYWTVLFFALLLPLTNSAMTDFVNNDHRLTPLLPVIAVATAAGLGAVWRAAAWLRNRWAIRAVEVVTLSSVLLAAAGPAYRFFSEEQGRRPDLDNHLLYFALSEIESTPVLRQAPELCVGGNATTTATMGLLHVRDGWKFFLPGKTIHAAELRPAAAPNELYISTTCEPKASDDVWSGTAFCTEPALFVCPARETGAKDVRIYVDTGAAPPG